MKIAILGSSPIALEAALQFHHHGAAVSWFNAPEKEGEAFFDEDYADRTSELGRSILKNSPSQLNWMGWKEFYQKPLEEFLKAHQEVKSHQVVSVTKRFLAPGETIKDKSRFLDLFRLTYQINPENFIEEQKKSNPETYERLSSEFVQSLQSTLEMYEDFDLVMDMRRETGPTSMGVSGRALGESRISRDKVFYGLGTLGYSPGEEIRELALIGSDLLAGEILIRLGNWLRDPRTRLFVATTEAMPFEKFFAEAIPSHAVKLRALFDFMEAEFEQEVNAFHHKLRDWQALDDFVQAKISKPVEPIPRLVFFSGHNATAVDQLIDKNRLFLTLEKPSFREGLRQPDNNLLDLKTIGVEEILVATEMKKPEMFLNIDDNEVGYFALKGQLPNRMNGFALELSQLKGMTNEIFKLFSPADSH